MPAFTFETTPLVGTIIALDEQHYRLSAAEPHTCKDGRASAILTWGAQCPDCGDPFECKTGLSLKNLNRRCPDCHRPRQRVRRSRRHVAVKLCLVVNPER